MTTHERLVQDLRMLKWIVFALEFIVMVALFHAFNLRAAAAAVGLSVLSYFRGMISERLHCEGC